MRKNIDYFIVDPKKVDPIFQNCIYKKDKSGSWGLYSEIHSNLNVWGNLKNDGSITFETVKSLSLK